MKKLLAKFSILKKIKTIRLTKWQKRFLGLFLFLGCSSMFVPGGSFDILEIPQVFAQNDDINKTFTDKIFLLNGFLKVLYILLRPLLAIAGASLDNSLVYGSVFHLDEPLWKLWNIIKNFANFALGFLVLREILKGMFTFGTDAISKPMEVIKKALVAGILIQSSWFLVGAVIDISTIATVAIGGMPMSVLEGSKLLDKPILTRHNNYGLKDVQADNISSFSDNLWIWYSYPPFKDNDDAEYIAKCRVARLGSNSYIVGRSMPVIPLPGYKDFAKGLCVYGDQYVISFSEMQEIAVGDVVYDVNSVANDSTTSKSTYKQALDNVLATNGAFTKNKEGIHYPVGASDGETFNTKENLAAPIVIDGNMGTIMQKSKIWFAQYKGGMTLSKLVKKLKSMTGPLITLYSSLLNYAEITDLEKTTGENNNIGGERTELLIKSVFALALLIPLGVLAVVLLARIGYLWLIIAFIPALILGRLFKLEGGDSKLPKVGEVMGVIFSPVITVFALSICLVFMTALNFSVDSPQNKADFYKEFEMQKNDKGQIEIGMITLEHDEDDVSKFFGNAKDLISWLFVNMFAVGLVWFVLFAALKANTIGAKIVKNTQLDGFMQKALMSIPIYHTGTGKDRVGISAKSIGDAFSSAPSQAIATMSKNQGNKVQQILGLQDSSTGNNNYTAADAARYRGIQASMGNKRNSGMAEELGFKGIESSTAFKSTSSSSISDAISKATNGGHTTLSRGNSASLSKSTILNALNSESFDKTSLGAGSTIKAQDGKFYRIMSHPRMAGTGSYYELIDLAEEHQKELKSSPDDAARDKYVKENEKLKKQEEEWKEEQKNEMKTLKDKVDKLNKPK